ncbi:hypothetical protein [Spirulina sp. 06S082]|uniref:hypothetical protein n=1 Tax=Spirulina sp. 06S082 TaxID=3110248 RepID=UPI002B1F68AC|nr:hypothetical protein [Spirulina sp. 06S082]MEA5468965.1 hypothetical protein [Spirulina sp. 06S082]
MSILFPIIEIPSLDAPEEWEEMGTKEKFWFRDRNERLCLYKKARPNTGEDWSEKVAAELCQLLSLPHADYELATFNGSRGIISPSFRPEMGRLDLGNDVLFKLIPDYPKNVKAPSQHTLDNVFQVIGDPSVKSPSDWTLPEGIETAADVFIGYLMLDAWIGNSDRHHENWAFIRVGQQNYLAPTYDHASSLGRNESDSKRQERLTTKDRGFSIEAYTDKCKSCLYAKISDSKPLKTFDAFRKATEFSSKAARIWLERLAIISAANTLELFEQIPPNRITPIAIEFACKILEINQTKLLELL